MPGAGLRREVAPSCKVVGEAGWDALQDAHDAANVSAIACTKDDCASDCHVLIPHVSTTGDVDPSKTHPQDDAWQCSPTQIMDHVDKPDGSLQDLHETDVNTQRVSTHVSSNCIRMRTIVCIVCEAPAPHEPARPPWPEEVRQDSKELSPLDRSLRPLHEMDVNAQRCSTHILTHAKMHAPVVCEPLASHEPAPALWPEEVRPDSEEFVALDDESRSLLLTKSDAQQVHMRLCMDSKAVRNITCIAREALAPREPEPRLWPDQVLHETDANAKQVPSHIPTESNLVRTSPAIVSGCRCTWSSCVAARCTSRFGLMLARLCDLAVAEDIT